MPFAASNVIYVELAGLQANLFVLCIFVKKFQEDVCIIVQYIYMLHFTMFDRLLRCILNSIGLVTKIRLHYARGMRWNVRVYWVLDWHTYNMGLLCDLAERKMFIINIFKTPRRSHNKQNRKNAAYLFHKYDLSN